MNEVTLSLPLLKSLRWSPLFCGTPCGLTYKKTSERNGAILSGSFATTASLQSCSTFCNSCLISSWSFKDFENVVLSSLVRVIFSHYDKYKAAPESAVVELVEDYKRKNIISEVIANCLIELATELLTIKLHKGEGKAKFASAHDLRRSCASRLATARVPEREIAKVLRHQDVETTRKYYAPGTVQESAGIIRDTLNVPRYITKSEST